MSSLQEQICLRLIAHQYQTAENLQDSLENPVERQDLEIALIALGRRGEITARYSIHSRSDRSVVLERFNYLDEVPLGQQVSDGELEFTLRFEDVEVDHTLSKSTYKTLSNNYLFQCEDGSWEWEFKVTNPIGNSQRILGKNGFTKREAAFESWEKAYRECNFSDLEVSPSGPQVTVLGSSKLCDNCKGTGNNPKKRKQSCPVRFCGRGKVPLIAAMCDCECHETPGTQSFGDCYCCIFSGALRKDIEQDPNYNPQATVPDLGDLLTQKAQKDLDAFVLSDVLQPGDCEICGKPDGH